jgi:hypothetical protein
MTDDTLLPFDLSAVPRQNGRCFLTARVSHFFAVQEAARGPSRPRRLPARRSAFWGEPASGQPSRDDHRPSARTMRNRESARREGNRSRERLARAADKGIAGEGHALASMTLYQVVRMHCKRRLILIPAVVDAISIEFFAGRRFYRSAVFVECCYGCRQIAWLRRC